MDAPEALPPAPAISAFVLSLPAARRQALRNHPVAGCFALATACTTNSGLARAVAELDRSPEYQRARARIGQVKRPTARARYQAAALYGNRELTVAMARDHEQGRNSTVDRCDELNRSINSALRGIHDLRGRHNDPEREVTEALAVLADLDRAHELARTIAGDLGVDAASDVARDLARAGRCARDITLRLAVDFVRDRANRPLLDGLATFVLDHLLDARTVGGDDEDQRTLSRLLRETEAETEADHAATLVWLHGAITGTG
jgi:hypothetical protein